LVLAFQLVTFLPYHTLEITELSRVITIHHLDVIHTSTEDKTLSDKPNHHFELEGRHEDT
jgi:plasmid maintenance system killer protein